MLNENEKVARLIILFMELKNLIYENSKQSVRGIEGILAILFDESCTLKERLHEASSTYSSMVSIRSGLGDFAFYHKNIEIQSQLNNLYKKIDDEIWSLLPDLFSHLPSIEEGYPPDHIYWSIKDPK